MERAVKATKTKMLNMEKKERESVCVCGEGWGKITSQEILFYFQGAEH